VKILPDVSVHREKLEVLHIWIQIEEFLQDSSTLWDWAFSTIWLTSLEKTDRIFTNISSQRYLWTRIPR